MFLPGFEASKMFLPGFEASKMFLPRLVVGSQSEVAQNVLFGKRERRCTKLVFPGIDVRNLLSQSPSEFGFEFKFGF